MRRRVAVLIGELLFDNLVATGAARAVLEFCKEMGMEDDVLMLGTSGDGNSCRKLNATVKLVFTGDEKSAETGRLVQEYLDQKIDVFICAADQAIPIAIRARKDIGESVPIIVWHQFSPDNYDETLELGLWRTEVDYIVVPTDHEAVRIRKSWPDTEDKVRVVKIGISQPRIRSKTIAATKRRFIFIGRRTIAKGYPVWLRACELLSQQLHDVDFLTIGLPGTLRCPYTAQLSAMLESSGRLRQMDYCTPRDLLNNIAASKALVLPTRKDCMPISILEAMHLKVPVVASNIPNIRELSGDPSSIIMVNALSPRSVAAGMERALLETGPIRQMVARAQEIAESQFTADVMSRSLLAVIGDVLARRAGSAV